MKHLSEVHSENSPKSYLNALYGSYEPGCIFTLCEIPKGGVKLNPYHCESISEVLTQAEALSHNHVYLTTGVYSTKPAKGRGTATDVTGLSYFWMDIDHAGGVHKKAGLPTKEQALTFIDSLPLKASIIVDSGGGFYPIWAFDKPLIFANDADRAKTALLSQLII